MQVLKLDDIVCGPVSSAEGGDISAPVIREQAGSFYRKGLGEPVIEPIVLSLDLSLTSAVYEWIAEFWEGKVTSRNGSVISLDLNGQAKSELAFEQATITATTLPGMDSASKTPCQLSVRLNAERTTRRPASGRILGPIKRWPWLPSNFRLSIEGLDTTRVSKIEPLTVVADKGAIDFGDVRLLISASAADAWSDWHRRFVVDGTGDEKSGTLVYHTPDLKNVLGEVTMQGLGIHRLRFEPVPERSEQIGRVAAELYCERMELAVHGSREASEAPLAGTTAD